MQEESLRERKKARTWHDIHVAAAEAVLERGLQAVTVEDIAASVGISQRTFFNYFPTKDHAVVGVREPAIPDGAAERPPEGASTLRSVVELYMQLLISAMPADSAGMRRRLMGAHPDLGRLLKDTMHSCEHMVRDAVRRSPRVRELLAEITPGVRTGSVSAVDGAARIIAAFGADLAQRPGE